MTRKVGFVVPGCPLHVIQRATRRQAFFFHTVDYCFYLQCLWQAAQRHCCAVHAYVLMPNHVHLLVTPGHDPGVSQMLHSVGQRYRRYVNAAHRRPGTLWDYRYKTAFIHRETCLLACYRYIELKPVRAGMVLHPQDYRWSSYRFHAEGERNRIIQDHALYSALGPSGARRRNAYQALFQQPVELDTLARLYATRQGGRVPGNDLGVSRARPAAAPG